MLLHVVADQEDRISALRTLLEPQYRVTSSLLRKESNVPKGCDAAVVSADIKNADNITALKEVSAKFKGAKRKIYILDEKARLQAAQAYALGATHVLFNPVTTEALLRVLIDPGAPIKFPEEAGREKQQGARGAASSIEVTQRAY